MKNKWRCGACGYLLEIEIPPDVCPSCKQKCEFIDNNCYTPDCGCSTCFEEKGGK